MVTSKQLRLAVKKEEQDWSYRTAQVVLGDRGRKKSKKKSNEFDLDLIWI